MDFTALEMPCDIIAALKIFSWDVVHISQENFSQLYWVFRNDFYISSSLALDKPVIDF